VSTAILGFSKVEYVDENLKALALYKKWTPEIEAKCLEILNNEPDGDYEYITYNLMP